jgi:hypothetical protein
MNDNQPQVVMEEVTDPVQVAAANARRAKFDRNWAWHQAHVGEIGETHRGRCIAVAGEELFVADTPEEAAALARAAHPDDDGFFVHYIHRERAYRI